MQCRTAGNDLPWSGLCNVVTVVATLTHIYIYHKNVNYLLPCLSMQLTKTSTGIKIRMHTEYPTIMVV